MEVIASYYSAVAQWCVQCPQSSLCQCALYSLFDFIAALLEVRALQRVLLPTLTELIYHLLSYMMISEAQVGGAGQSATPPHTLL